LAEAQAVGAQEQQQPVSWQEQSQQQQSSLHQQGQLPAVVNTAVPVFVPAIAAEQDRLASKAHDGAECKTEVQGQGSEVLGQQQQPPPTTDLGCLEAAAAAAAAMGSSAGSSAGSSSYHSMTLPQRLLSAALPSAQHSHHAQARNTAGDLVQNTSGGSSNTNSSGRTRSGSSARKAMWPEHVSTAGQDAQPRAASNCRHS
jgi:hypothetical protein